MAVTRIPKLLLTLSAALVVIALACGGEAEPASAPSPAPPVDRATLHGVPPGVELPKLIGPKQYDGPPPMLIDPSKTYTAHLEMEKGRDIIIDLFADKAPKTVNNFVFLARDGFYDGLNFYQVTLSGDARAGDPTGTGTGGPGYYTEDEFHLNLRHGYATVTMDNDRKPNTNGSRFMIITQGARDSRATGFSSFSSTAHLDGLNPDGSPKDCAYPEVPCHSVFGKLPGSSMSPAASRVSLIRARNPETAETPGSVIKTIRIEVSE